MQAASGSGDGHSADDRTVTDMPDGFKDVSARTIILLSTRKEAAMSVLLTSLIVLATLATIGTLFLGIWSMVYNGEDGPFDSDHWMRYRVALQAIALLALVATFFVRG
jgi:hypothetical protein